MISDLVPTLSFPLVCSTLAGSLPAPRCCAWDVATGLWGPCVPSFPPPAVQVFQGPESHRCRKAKPPHRNFSRDYIRVITPYLRPGPMLCALLSGGLLLVQRHFSRGFFQQLKDTLKKEVEQNKELKESLQKFKVRRAWLGQWWASCLIRARVVGFAEGYLRCPEGDLEDSGKRGPLCQQARQYSLEGEGSRSRRVTCGRRGW
jgi:hypothetical protein